MKLNLKLIKMGPHIGYWRGPCTSCGSVFQESVEALKAAGVIINSPGGDFAIVGCPMCKVKVETVHLRPYKLPTETAEGEVARLRCVIKGALTELVNVQPHIPQSCYPGHEKFIDAHVGAAIELLSTGTTE